MIVKGAESDVKVKVDCRVTVWNSTGKTGYLHLFWSDSPQGSDDGDDRVCNMTVIQWEDDFIDDVEIVVSDERTAMSNNHELKIERIFPHHEPQQHLPPVKSQTSPSQQQQQQQSAVQDSPRQQQQQQQHLPPVKSQTSPSQQQQQQQIHHGAGCTSSTRKRAGEGTGEASPSKRGRLAETSLQQEPRCVTICDLFVKSGMADGNVDMPDGRISTGGRYIMKFKNPHQMGDETVALIVAASMKDSNGKSRGIFGALLIVLMSEVEAESINLSPGEKIGLVGLRLWRFGDEYASKTAKVEGNFKAREQKITILSFDSMQSKILYGPQLNGNLAEVISASDGEPWRINDVNKTIKWLDERRNVATFLLNMILVQPGVRPT